MLIQREVFSSRNRFKDIDVGEFRKQDREKGEGLFWNMIYYFNNHGLPYDIILPYKDTKDLDKIDT